MNRTRHLLFAAIIATVLAACSKKELSEEKPNKHEENIVTLTKASLEHVELKTEPVRIASLETTLKAAGRVTENANKTAKVTSTLEGRLIKLNFDLNDPVKTGDVLALVQTPELLGKPLELRSPIDGVVIERKSAPGELVGREKEIFTISDPMDLWVIAEIKERDIGQVRVGQDAAFTVIAYPGEQFHGKIVRISNTVEAESRTLEARIETRNEDGRLKPGMFADVEIVTTVLQSALVVSDAALQSEDDRQIAFVALGHNRFEKRVVKIGLERQAKVQVLEGLEEGEQIVTEGSFILKSEMLKGELGDE